jgi:hypothetical protein
MSPTIRIDEEVYKWLQTQAMPFEDTPNSVLRRIADLDKKLPITNKYKGGNDKMDKVDGKTLNELWKVGARHSLYHKDGCWYNNLTDFPGALFDPNGYILFNSEADYLKCPYLKITQETNVPGGISTIPGYVNKR